MRARAAWRALRLAAALAVALSAPPAAALDLSRAAVTRLPNGLTLVVLEAPLLPVVSVQALYRVGARNEPLGQSGIAHYLEHMAFRASENFPDTDVVSAIYAVGGEWHGYTWLDQTTYFETLPVEHLDLALRIEADRMARLEIPAAEVEAERGAVLAEMHGYENDPATVLKDSVLAVSFLEHPYRNNTIGWESDVRAISHADLVAFYRRHYRPANAVLAVVGAVSAPAVEARVLELFGELPAGEPSAPPPTVEPPQVGVRRVELPGGAGVDRFEIAYRAPAATDSDYPAFLLLEQLLGGGRGVNFAQNAFGDAVRADGRLHGVTDDLLTWYPPQAAPYVFTVAGSLPAGRDRAGLEAALERVMARVRSEPPTADELAAARRRLLDELVFDVETTEDAAHQLAYFIGLGDLDVLLELPRRLAEVTPLDVQRVARRRLQPWQRTIGWSLAGESRPATMAGEGETPPPPRPARRRPPASERAATAERPAVAAPPRVIELSNGLPVLFQRLPLSSSAYLRILVPATGLELPGAAAASAVGEDEPVWRHTSIDYRFRPRDLEEVLRQAARALDGARPAAVDEDEASEDPATRLAAALDALSGVGPAPPATGAAAVALAGDLEEREVRPLLEAAFGDWTPAAAGRSESAPPPAPCPQSAAPCELVVELASPMAQAQLGWVVPAPPIGDPEGPAWRALLYVLAHGYEGRLGKEAISNRGLLYWIDAAYDGDGRAGRIVLRMGVDPDKLEPLRRLLGETLDGLAASPPDAAEVAEARAHLLGRRASAAQSNEEVSAALLRDWVAYGELLTDAAFAERVAAATPEAVERILPAFLRGSTAVVRFGARPAKARRAPAEPVAREPEGR